jgi:putative glutamine amidotransferase
MKQGSLAPVIAITTSAIAEHDGNGHRKHISRVNNRYVALVTDFGAIPVLMFAECKPTWTKELLSRVDGLIIIGGQDLDPKTYGEDNLVRYDPALRGSGGPFHRPMDLAPNRRRDDFEIALYQSAMDMGVPVLGICRGMQLINVAEGGTLAQEMEQTALDHSAGDDGFVHHHPIELAQDSFTRKALQTSHYFTSSIHHQAVSRLGHHLRKAGWSPDDNIEVIERIDDEHFALGILGHIEQTRRNLPLYDRLIKAFIARCSEGKPGRDVVERLARIPAQE